MTCLTLANPSSSIIARHHQERFIDEHTESRCRVKCDHRCHMRITIDHHALERQAFNELLCIQVTVPEDIVTTEPIRIKTEEYDSAVTRVLLEHYQIGCNAVMVIDQNTSMKYVQDALDRYCSDSPSESSKCVVFDIARGRRTDPVVAWSRPVILAEPLGEERILSLLRHAHTHILTGSRLGMAGADSATSLKRVYYPSPYSCNRHLPENWIPIPCYWPRCRYWDKIYYINLDHRTDRKQHMEEQMKRLNLQATRVPAVDGRKVEWRKELGTRTKFWGPGAHAYCLSYRAAVVDAMRNNYDSVLILDDDAALADNLMDVLSHAFRDLPANWHMLYLAANHGYPQPTSMPTEADRIGDYLYRLKGSMGSHAIIVNKVAFPALLRYTAGAYAPLDTYLSLYQKFFPCYITYPGLATQLAGHSDIIQESVNYTEDWGIDYIHHVRDRK